MFSIAVTFKLYRNKMLKSCMFKCEEFCNLIPRIMVYEFIKKGKIGILNSKVLTY